MEERRKKKCTFNKKQQSSVEKDEAWKRRRNNNNKTSYETAAKELHADMSSCFQLKIRLYSVGWWACICAGPVWYWCASVRSVYLSLPHRNSIRNPLSFSQ